VDGAWPGSALDEDGRYLFDGHKGQVWSRLTFLIYLNSAGGAGGGGAGNAAADGGAHAAGGGSAADDADAVGASFEGGATTFFSPSADADGCLDARSVQPVRGSILVFPHGDAAGALVHEGSPVTSGAKYVVRSEVLYTRPPKDGGGRR